MCSGKEQSQRHGSAPTQGALEEGLEESHRAGPSEDTVQSSGVPDVHRGPRLLAADCSWKGKDPERAPAEGGLPRMDADLRASRRPRKGGERL